MAKIFKVPFASQGDKSPIPDAAQGDGSVSYNQGFGYDYERPYDDPQSKDIPREGMNQIFNDLSGAVGEIQAAGVAQWSPDADPYPIGAIVWRNNQLWQSTVALNAGEPGVASGWAAIDAKRLRDATESVKGVAQIATQAQVNAGTDDSGVVTPKKAAARYSEKGHTHPISQVTGLQGELGKMFGVDQTWQEVSRATGTNYTNSTGKPIAVMVRSVQGSPSASSINISCNEISISRVHLGGGSVSITRELSATGIIPSGATYRVEITGLALQQWVELR